MGRNEFAQLASEHASISRQHAAICYNPQRKSFYLIDLKSFHGSFINGKQIPAWDPKPSIFPFLIKIILTIFLVDTRDELTFGGSSRVYKLVETDEGRDKIEETVCPLSSYFF